MAGRRRTGRDQRRRSLGQNFLTDRRVLRRFIGSLDIDRDELVVDIGAGRGAIALAVADAGASVWAVERDPAWAAALVASTRAMGLDRSVRVITTDVRRLRLPATPYRVVANPPFGLTTQILALLLDRPERAPDRVDLIVQREVARKHTAQPPIALRTAAWAPWWTFTLGRSIGRDAFRPKPSVDAAVLHIRRRDPPILPERLAPDFRETLRPAWERGQR